MKKIYIVVLLILVATSVVFGQRKTTPKPTTKPSAHPSQMPKWYTLTNTEGRFKIDFPAKPEEKETAAGPLFTASTQNIAFFANYAHINPNPFHPDDALALQGDISPTFPERQIKGEGGNRFIQGSRIKKGIAEAEYWMIEGQEKKHVFRRYIIGNHSLTQLVCANKTSNETVDKNLCTKFFDSFRFTVKPQNVSSPQYATRVCPACHGHGYTTYTGACPQCNGFGKEADDEVCSLCRGNRMVIGQKRTCPHCGGVGRIKR